MKTITQALRRHARYAITGILACALALVGMFSGTQSLRSDNFVFYLPASRGVIPIQTFGKSNYLPLLQILNLVGRVDALRESPRKLRVWFGQIPLEVEDSNRKIKVDKKTVSLSEPVRHLNGQWFVPVDFVSAVLPGLVTGGVEYRPGENRIFIGGARPSTFSVRASEIPNGTRLRMEFTSPMTFQTASRDGKWILSLGDKPVQPLEQKFQFDSVYVRGLEFDDHDGYPKLIITPATSGLDLYPVLEEGGKVLRADIVKPGAAEQPAPAETAQTPSPGAAPESQTAVQEEMPGAPAPLSGPVVVLDAGHGGQDPGAEGSNGLLEKNLVAQLVVRVRATILATRHNRVIHTRVGDTDPDFDQRAMTANTARATFFISFHAGDLNLQTPRVAVYAFEPPNPTVPSSGVPRPLFVPWNEIQSYHLEDSQRLAQAIRDQLAAPPGLLNSSPGVAPVRVLRSINAPAVAIEIGSLTPSVDSSALLTTDFQQKISNAVLAALETFARKAT
ncbi:MAG: N-acetylmuramoyl-L-alanine amidase family protein [Deltaproteobacteria bacterium]